jgi:glycosyltransferase involved in cell wall biosynthesis
MKVLFIALVWPEPNSSAGGTRTFQIIKWLKENNFDLTVASSCQDNSYRQDLEALNIKTESIKLNSSCFDKFVCDLNPTVVIYDRFISEEQFGFRVKNTLPNVISVLDTIDLHFLRRARQNKISDFSLESEDTLRELSSIIRSDFTLVVSEFEKSLLDSILPFERETVFNIPFYINKSPFIFDFNERKDFCFIGNYNHKPNVDAALLLAKHIWPNILENFKSKNLELPKLDIYGAYPTQQINELANKSKNITVHGRINDSIETLSKYRVNLAPLEYGAGIKGKILDGWAGGTPVVTTEIGAEGMSCGDLFGGLVIKSAGNGDFCLEFANQAFNLYCDYDLFMNLQGYGFKIIESKFSHSVFNDSFSDFFRTVISETFVKGALKQTLYKILNYQFNRSTEFFSKWIEAKNVK